MSEHISISLSNPRRNPKYISLGILSLVLGVFLDRILFTEEILIMAYIPLMIMAGILFRFVISIVILAGLVTLYIYNPSSVINWSMELFLFRWMSYFFVAYIVRTLIINGQKEKQNLINMTSTLSESIDARDKYTSSHSLNVAYYSREIAKAMNLSRKTCDHLYVGGLLHDIGKIGVPEAILNKPGRLTEEEFEKIKEHPQMGYNILKYIPYFNKNGLLDMVLYHHEKYNGTGYPHGLKGENIPLEARIMAVADAFDAMTSRRVYRNKRDLDFALNELVKGKGSQFDPEIADIFLDLIEKDQIVVRGSKPQNKPNEFASIT